MLIHKSIESSDSQQKIIPNGLLYIGAELREKGHRVILENFTNLGEIFTREKIKEAKPKIVGISCYTFNATEVFELCKVIKKIDPEIFIILGGTHATELHKEILERVNEVDAIIIGEGEETFCEAAEKIENNEELNNEGMTYRKNGEIIEPTKREFIKELDELQIPAKYYSYHRIITSRGCPGQCIFCSTPNFWGRHVRFRSPESVVAELEILNKKYGIGYFIFSDDTFSLNKNRVIELCKLIIDKGLKITWDCRSRVNCICEERIKWMKKAGCISISYGIESGSEEILKNLNKNITKEQIIKASEWTKKHGLQLNWFLIVGSPGEDDSTINETIELLERIKPHDAIVSIMQLTPDVKLCKEQEISIEKWFKNSEETVYYTKEHRFEKLQEYADKVNESFKNNKGGYSFEELVRFIKEDPEDFQSFNTLGAYYLAKGKTRDACICFIKSIKINKSFSQAHNNLGIITVKSGNNEKALELFKKASQLNPEDTSSLKNMGLTLLKMNRNNEAKECFEKILEIDPENQEAKKYLI